MLSSLNHPYFRLGKSIINHPLLLCQFQVWRLQIASRPAPGSDAIWGKKCRQGNCRLWKCEIYGCFMWFFHFFSLESIYWIVWFLLLSMWFRSLRLCLCCCKWLFSGCVVGVSVRFMFFLCIRHEFICIIMGPYQNLQWLPTFSSLMHLTRKWLLGHVGAIPINKYAAGLKLKSDSWLQKLQLSFWFQESSQQVTHSTRAAVHVQYWISACKFWS